MPGIATLNNGNSQVVSMSCTASGDCAAAGTYQRQGNRIFVAGESGGTWGNAEQLPGMATLNKGNVFLRVNQVSCGKPGNCVAGGAYTDAAGHGQAWLAAETGGIWHAAHAVAGLAALNQGGAATVLAVSCPARTSGECTAAGYYNTAGQADQLGFVISQQSGKWGPVTPIPGQSSLSGEASFTGINISSLSCGAAGDRAAVGSYIASPGSLSTVAFVVTETGGVWGDAGPVPGLAALANVDSESATSVSCWSVGHCSAGGSYSFRTSTAFNTEAFVVDETGGTWQTAQEVPGTAALNTANNATTYSVSCAPGGM